MGYIDESGLTAILSNEYGIPSINLAELEIPPNILEIIPSSVVRLHRLLPVNRAGASLVVAMADPSDIFAIDAVRGLTGMNVEVVVASENALIRAVERYYPTGK